jgi:hypothetical protein
MRTICRAYSTESDARMAVDRLLAAEFGDETIRVVTGSPAPDHRDEPHGDFADRGAVAAPVGSFAGPGGSTGDAMGAFAGEGSGRRGGFGDLDRETVTTYSDGVRRVHVTSHRKLRSMLVEAGLDDEAAAADVEALHTGRVLVIIQTATSRVADATAVLDAGPAM